MSRIRPLLQWLALGCLLIGLWGCGGTEEMPPQVVVERAIALRMAHVQQQLITHLAPSVPQTPNFKIRQVTITERRPATGLENLYQVSGSYDALIQLPSRQAAESGNFQIYIQAEQDDRTDPPATQWYLAEPDDTDWQRTALAAP